MLLELNLKKDPTNLSLSLRHCKKSGIAYVFVKQCFFNLSAFYSPIRTLHSTVLSLTPQVFLSLVICAMSASEKH